MTKKHTIITILFLAIISSFVIYKIYNKPHVNVAVAISDVSLTADKIISDFSSDENIANKKYLEKIIEVKGVVSEIKVEKEKGIITLKTNDDFGNVICHLSKEGTKKISTLKENQTIVLKGICTGYLMDVILIKCELIN
jgi:DNA/RNA endonuclease YhcR with UshA esterase domain